MTIRNARTQADRPDKQRPEGFARKVLSCGVARLVEQNERSTFVARLASEHFSCKRGSQRVLHQRARVSMAGLKVTVFGMNERKIRLRSVHSTRHGRSGIILCLYTSHTH